MKALAFLGSSRQDLRDFPEEARRKAGMELMQVQMGAMPADFKPMPAVGAGAYEIRIQAGGAWRVIYVAKFEAAVYVLHAFGKKTQATLRVDVELAASRYRQINLSGD